MLPTTPSEEVIFDLVLKKHHLWRTWRTAEWRISCDLASKWYPRFHFEPRSVVRALTAGGGCEVNRWMSLPFATANHRDCKQDADNPH